MSLVIRLSLTIVIYDGAVLEKRWDHLMQLLKPMDPNDHQRRFPFQATGFHSEEFIICFCF